MCNEKEVTPKQGEYREDSWTDSLVVLVVYKPNLAFSEAGMVLN